MRLILFLWAAGQLAAQTFSLGTPSDPCTGGTPYTLLSTGATQRYGDFTCTFPVPVDGLYQVSMVIQEPCIGECTPPVTGPNQRAENVFLNDSEVLTGLDPYGAGSTSPSAPVTRTALVFSASLKVKLRTQTVLRNAVLSAVTITPYQVVQFARAVCQGSGTRSVPNGTEGCTDPNGCTVVWSCTGLEKWTVTTSAGTNTYAVSLDTDASFVNLQPCPASDPTKACWQVQPITAQVQVPPGNWVALAPAYMETISASSSLITLPFDVARACVHSVESVPKMAVGSQFPLDGSMWDQNCVRFSKVLPRGNSLSIWY